MKSTEANYSTGMMITYKILNSRVSNNCTNRKRNQDVDNRRNDKFTSGVGFKRKPIVSGSREDPDQPKGYDEHKLNGFGNLVERSSFSVVASEVKNGVEEGLHMTYFSSGRIVLILLLLVTTTATVARLLLVIVVGVTDDFWVIGGSSVGSMVAEAVMVWVGGGGSATTFGFPDQRSVRWGGKH
ncbi:hypothetical protein L6452_09403 [Arctium lappa]|uniref:Uncharacterized protein n=1 Tax=Arctium lappa TaxID=4217 RepID=A0ACB9DKH8_ARCLA|nr:hypothetical protein L6452_09403 [Arctium lappa]